MTLRNSGMCLRRFSLVAREIYFAGVLSLIIILVSGLFVGMVLGLQGYETLQKYGSESAVGTLVALSLVRELGPVVAALLFASRAGSAITAEIGLMKATEQLRNEHEGIKLMMHILGKLSGKLEAGEEVDPEHLEKIIEFFRVFADKCHHGKEENLLFPAMKEKQIADEISLIEELIEEHKAARNFARGMAEGIEAKNLGRFSENARGYISLLDRHIDKENNVLFPMADTSLSEEKKNELEAGFENVEKNVVGVGRHKELQGLIHQLKEIYK